MDVRECRANSTKNEERIASIEVAKEEALRERRQAYVACPESFRKVMETEVVTPTLEHVRELVGVPEVCAIAPANIPDFGSARCRSRRGSSLVIHPTHVHPDELNYLSSATSLRTTMLQAHYLKDCGTILEDHEQYMMLPKPLRQYFSCLVKTRHAFVANYIFGSQAEYSIVADKCHSDPLEIAKAYNVPYLYAMFELAELRHTYCHFLSCQNDKLYNAIGDNLDNILKEDINALLIGKLKWLSPSYHYRLIYKYSKIAGKFFICMGTAAVIRNKFKVYVFGIDSDYASDQLHYTLRELAIPMDSSILI